MKSQSNTEIAGSPRNSFRASLNQERLGGRALNGLGADKVTEPYQTPNTKHALVRSQTVGDKLHSREGNSPDRQLRSPSKPKCERMLYYEDNQDVGLEAATHLKSA